MTITVNEIFNYEHKITVYKLFSAELIAFFPSLTRKWIVLLKCESKAFECPLVFISTSLLTSRRTAIQLLNAITMRFGGLLRDVFHSFFLCQYTETSHVQDMRYKHREGHGTITELLRLEGSCGDQLVQSPAQSRGNQSGLLRNVFIQSAFESLQRERLYNFSVQAVLWVIDHSHRGEK